MAEDSFLRLVFPMSQCPDIDYPRANSGRLMGSGRGNLSILTTNTDGRDDARSFLLQAGVTAAREKLRQVIIVTRKPWPCWPTGQVDSMPVGDYQSLSLTNFVYPRNGRDLCLYLAALALKTASSDRLVIVEALDEFAGPGGEKLAKILALLVELVSGEGRHDTRCIATMGDNGEVDDKRLHLFANEVWHFAPGIDGRKTFYSPKDDVQFVFDVKKRGDSFFPTKMTRVEQ